MISKGLLRILLPGVGHVFIPEVQKQEPLPLACVWNENKQDPTVIVLSHEARGRSRYWRQDGWEVSEL